MDEMTLKKNLKKTFKTFEIQTNVEYLNRLKCEEYGIEYVGLDALKHNLEKADSVISAVGGVHFKDWKDKPNGTHVDRHIHVYVKLKDSRMLSTILGYVNGFTISEKNYIAPNHAVPESLAIGMAQIEAMHSNFSKCYDYLLHRDEKSRANPLKEEYTEEEAEVWTIGTTVSDVEADTEMPVKIGVANINKAERFWENYGADLTSGKINRWNFVTNPEIVSHEDYLQYKTQFEQYFERCETIRINEVNKEGSKMEVIYMYGSAGLGKTSFAKEMMQDRNIEYFVSGSSNDPFDGYIGQPGIILDDLRGSCMAFSDLLKALDNNTRSKVQSRYFNKVVLADLIVITSILPIEDLYKKFADQEEPLAQLKRRCKTMMYFTDDMQIKVYTWLPKLGDYTEVCTIPNPIQAKDFIDNRYELSKEEEEEFALKLLGGLVDGMKDSIRFAADNRDELRTLDEMKEGERYTKTEIDKAYDEYKKRTLAQNGNNKDLVDSKSEWVRKHKYQIMKG